jgi:hypothetical protein
VDVDGVVVSTGLQVERAFRGYNPHHRKSPSYYPIMAHLAETTHVLRVKNRSGNVHDGKASLGFLRDLWMQITPLMRNGTKVRFRMDGAFFRQDVLCWLQARGRRVCRQGSLLRMVGPATVYPFATQMDAGRARRDGIRRASRNNSLASFSSGDDLQKEGPSSFNEEFPTRPL